MGRDRENLEALIEEIITDAYGDDEQLWAFLQAFEDQVELPAEGFVIGERVSVTAFDYNGNTHQGLTAKCRTEDGKLHTVTLSDVVFPGGTTVALYHSCYRKWLGLKPEPAAVVRKSSGKRQPARKITDAETVALIVLGVKERAAPCRILGTEQRITLRSADISKVVPGEIITVKPRKQWNYKGHSYLIGDMQARRIDVAALGLAPLRLTEQGMWNPADEYWGEKGEPIEDCLKPIIARGPRKQFEMEQILQMDEPDDPFDDPISRANDLKDEGKWKAALSILTDLTIADLRCLDAHAHLGNFEFEHSPEQALRHYEIGVRIGDLSVDDEWDCVLPWGVINNRPFLRCLHGYALCLWRLQRFDVAGKLFQRMLWLNPSDNQGIRFLVDDVSARRSWESVAE